MLHFIGAAFIFAWCWLLCYLLLPGFKPSWNAAIQGWLAVAAIIFAHQVLCDLVCRYVLPVVEHFGVAEFVIVNTAINSINTGLAAVIAFVLFGLKGRNAWLCLLIFAFFTGCIVRPA